jgi:hypothetical protein
MILIAGGTGTLGTRIVRLLKARGLEMRLLTRDPARARHLEDDLVEVVAGDARGPAGPVERATSGAQTVISAIQGFSGKRWIQSPHGRSAGPHKPDPGRLRYGYVRCVLRPVGYLSPLSVDPAYAPSGGCEAGLRRLSRV